MAFEPRSLRGASHGVSLPGRTRTGRDWRYMTADSFSALLMPGYFAGAAFDVGDSILVSSLGASSSLGRLLVTGADPVRVIRSDGQQPVFAAGTPLLAFGSSTIQRAVSYSSGSNTLHKSLFGDVNVLEALGQGAWTQENRPDAANSRGFSGTNFGYSGATSYELKDYLPAIGAHPSPVVMLAAQNDYMGTDGNRAYNNVLDNLVKPLIEVHGKTVLWRTNIPRDTVGANALAADAPERRYMMRQNDLIRAAAGRHGGVHCIDTWDALCDPSLGIAMPKAGISEDGSHLSYLGSGTSGSGMHPQVGRFFDEPAYSYSNAGNLLVFDPTTAGGAAGAGITGSAPNGMRLVSVAGNPFTVTPAADPVSGDANKALRFVGTPTVTGASNTLGVLFSSAPATGNSNLSLAALGLSGGNVVRAEIWVRVTKGMSNLAALEMRIEAQAVASGAILDTNARATLWTHSFATFAGVWGSVLEGSAILLRTEPLLIPAGMTHLRYHLRAIPGNTGNEIDLRIFRPRLERLAA